MADRPQEPFKQNHKQAPKAQSIVGTPRPLCGDLLPGHSNMAGDFFWVLPFALPFVLDSVWREQVEATGGTLRGQ